MNYKILAKQGDKLLIEVAISSEDISNDERYQNLSRSSKRSSNSHKKIINDIRNKLFQKVVTQAVKQHNYKHFYSPNRTVTINQDKTLVFVQGCNSYKNICERWKIIKPKCDVTPKDVSEYLTHIRNLYSDGAVESIDTVAPNCMVSLCVLHTTIKSLLSLHYIREVLGSRNGVLPFGLQLQLIEAKVGQVLNLDTPHGSISCFVQAAWSVQPITSEKLKQQLQVDNLEDFAKSSLEAFVTQMQRAYVSASITSCAQKESQLMLPLNKADEKDKLDSKSRATNSLISLLFYNFIPAEHSTEFRQQAAKIPLSDIGLSHTSKKAVIEQQRLKEQCHRYIMQSAQLQEPLINIDKLKEELMLLTSSL